MRFVFLGRLVAAVLLLFLVGACANNGEQKSGWAALKSPEEKVMFRAQARWDALLSGRIDQAYEFISPASRLNMPVSDYRTRVSLQYARNAKPLSANCEAELCVVKLNFDYVLNGMALSYPINETWIQDGGEWWFVFRG